MKVLILKNRYTKKLNWKKGIEWFAKNTPLKLDITEISTDLDFKFREVKNDSFKGYIIDDYQKIAPYTSGYDVACIVFGNKAPGVKVSYAWREPLGRCHVISVVDETDGGKTFNHELIHVIFNKLALRGIVLNDPMDTYLNDKNLDAKVSNRTIALELLKPYWNLLNQTELQPKQPTIPKHEQEWSYKWFNLLDDPKMLGLEHELMVKLDAIRDEAGFPIVITSGKRTKAENDALKDSASNSGHLRGFEVDIACTDSAKRDRIIELSYKHGITRRGIGKDFIHLGIDPSLPQHVMWHYYK